MTKQELQDEVAYWEWVAEQWRGKNADYERWTLEKVEDIKAGRVNGWLADDGVFNLHKFRNRAVSTEQ